MKNKKLVIGLPIVLIFSLFAFLHLSSEKTYNMRWVAAHNPTNRPVIEMTQKAASNIERLSQGRIKIEVVAYGNDKVRRHQSAIDEVLAGTATLAQVDAGELRRFSTKMDVLNMPFLLNSHERVRAVINGSVGEQLIDAVEAGSDGVLRIMGFTYSGGFRVMYGATAVNSLSDLKGKKSIISGPDPVQKYYKSLGVEFISGGPFTRANSISLHENGQIDIEDSELNRLYVLTQDYPGHIKNIKFVSETNHLFYLTTLLANSSYLNALPSDLREIFEKEVAALAEAERSFSIEQAKLSKLYLIENGVQWVSLSNQNLKKFEEHSLAFRKSYDSELGPLIAEIEAIQEPPQVKPHALEPAKKARRKLSQNN